MGIKAIDENQAVAWVPIWQPVAIASSIIACVAGISREREGERERGRKMGF